MHARQIEPSRLTAADWSLARDALLPALERSGGTHTERDLIEGIGGGYFHLWLGDESAILSEVINYPRLKAHRCFLAGGNLDEILRMEPEIALDGSLLGCTRHEFDGRPGWERVLRPLGYAKTAIRMFRSI